MQNGNIPPPLPKKNNSKQCKKTTKGCGNPPGNLLGLSKSQLSFFLAAQTCIVHFNLQHWFGFLHLQAYIFLSFEITLLTIL
jgi:hypothetical protein